MSAAALRPDLGPALGALLEDLGRAVPEAFGPVDPRRILVVAGAARREARASIRPLGPEAADGQRWVKPTVHVHGARALYEITLRPLFFRATAPDARVLTLAHELWHAGPTFDGTLSASRRHAAAQGEQVEAAVREAVARWRQRSPRAEVLTRPLAEPGERVLAAWLRRPPSRIPVGSRVRRDYDERDLYAALVEQL